MLAFAWVMSPLIRAHHSKALKGPLRRKPLRTYTQTQVGGRLCGGALYQP